MIGTWMLRGGRLVQPAPFCLVGIVNATPDSFFDGGAHNTPDAAVAHGLKLLAEGAHLLDLGAESTRPGAQALGPSPEAIRAEEMARLLPVVAGLRAARPGCLLCVDTCHAATAKASLALGVDVINDVSAFERDPELLDVIVEAQPGYVLMHGGDRGGTSASQTERANIVDEVLHFFEQKLTLLQRAGLDLAHVVLDPGIGFGKTLNENIALLSGVERLHALGRPLYVGVSMKSLFSTLYGLALTDRGEATRIATALLATRGVCYHRVHDVAPAAIALSMAEWYLTPSN